MKRILSGLACVAMLALVGSGIAQASAHRKHRVTTTSAVTAVGVSQSATASDGGSCPISAHCPAGSCPFRSSATAAAASVPAMNAAAHGACTASDASKCPASCPRTTATSAVAVKVSSR